MQQCKIWRWLMAMLLLSGGGEGAAMERSGGTAAASMERWCAVVCGIPSD
ncbi:hypothetical protein [Levyella massiliensis]